MGGGRGRTGQHLLVFEYLHTRCTRRMASNGGWIWGFDGPFHTCTCATSVRPASNATPSQSHQPSPANQPWEPEYDKRWLEMRMRASQGTEKVLRQALLALATKRKLDPRRPGATISIVDERRLT